jgi:hypothetical protein
MTKNSSSLVFPARTQMPLGGTDGTGGLLLMPSLVMQGFSSTIGARVQASLWPGGETGRSWRRSDSDVKPSECVANQTYQNRGALRSSWSDCDTLFGIRRWSEPYVSRACSRDNLHEQQGRRPRLVS